MVRRLMTHRAIGAWCIASVSLAVAAVFAFGATPLAVLPALVCVLTMAPAAWIAGDLREGGRR